jgi:threonyl-tRNA synthetase
MPRLSIQDREPIELPEGEPVGSALPPGAVAARVSGGLRDLSFVPTGDAVVEGIFPDSSDGLHILRHSTAHVMARAVCELFPGTKYAIGPPIEDGFYYDFDLPSTIHPQDLPKIERRMRELIAADEPFLREEISRKEAEVRFADQPFKLEVIEGIEEAETEVASGEVVSVYRNGEWEDLCQGPHVASAGRLGAFKLMSVAGAYWRGDETRPMLQRVYGTAWASEDDLETHLHRLQEAERRDHRKLGRQLDLFSSPDELGPGLWVWHPRGGVFRKELEDWVRDLHLERGYELVVTPHIARSVLWETSGHLAKYAENMYPPMHTESGDDYYVKPMNCPFHVLIYKAHVRSYRDLPMRLSELGTIYRHEKVGALHGLLRIRGGTQDDSHIICTPDQLVDEILGVFDLTLEIHQTFGFDEPVVELSTLPADQSIVDESTAARATEALTRALDKSGLDYRLAEGEGAFYGPKVDFHFADAIGRLWQLTTVQCDFALPERFDMEYTGEDNRRHRPVMIHRAILGTLERFSGVLIEHYAGAFPLWMSPEQVRFVPVADRHVEHCRMLADEISHAGLRPFVDETKESVGKKIRASQLMKAPYTIVVGDRDIEAGTYTVRDREGNEHAGVPFDRIVSALATEARTRSLEQTDFGD